MQSWNLIIKQLLLGSAQAGPLPKESQLQLEHWQLQHIGQEQLELQYLQALAAQSLFKKAELPLGQLPEEAPKTKKIQDEQQAAPQKASWMLQQILSRRQEELLPAWIDLAHSQNWRVAPDNLADILTFGSRHKELRPAIISVLGQTGRYLAQFKRSWSYAAIKELQEEELAQADFSSLLFWLQQERRLAPQNALKVIQQYWKEWSKKQRLEVLELLHLQISKADEAFLEEVQNDRRQEIRQAAVELLLLLPHTALEKRMQTALEQLIQYDGELLKVAAPEKLTAQLKKDGIREHYQAFSEGKNSNWLAQMIASVAPSYWAKNWGLSPMACLQLALNSDYRQALIWGWSKAAHRLKDLDWLMAFHQLFMQNEPKGKQALFFSLEFLYYDLPSSFFNELAMAYLRASGKRSIDDEDPIMQLLLQEGQSWEAELGRQVLEAMKISLAQGFSVFQWNHKTLLKRAAFALDESLFEDKELLNNWPQLDYSWQKELDQFSAQISFRKELAQLKAL